MYANLCFGEMMEHATQWFQAEEIRFSYGEDMLAGTLSIPCNGIAPYPAIVFVHGSGPCEREASQELWKICAQHGFATLAWDKPGVGMSTGDWQQQSMAERAEESRAALKWLRSRGDIADTKIGVCGISEAGWVLPYICRSEALAFLIAIVVPTCTMIEELTFYLSSLLPNQGSSSQETTNALRYLKKRWDQIAQGVPYEEFDKAQQEIKQQAWLPYLGGYIDKDVYTGLLNNVDPTLFYRPDLRVITCPLLALFAGRDTNVDTPKSIDHYQQAMQGNGNRDVTIHVFANADHTMCDPDGRVVSGYYEELSRWLSARYALLNSHSS